jgi:hypothetical protein
LPPSRLSAIVADDQKKNLLWLVSGSIITAYDSETQLFSKPLNLAHDSGNKQVDLALLMSGDKGAFVTCGDYLYLTGRTFLRAAKKQWVVDQPGDPPDAPPRVTCPDKDLAEASIALYHGDFDKVKECVKQIPESRLSVGAVRILLGKLEGLRQNLTRAAATLAVPVAARSDAQPKSDAAPKPVSP